MTERRNSICQRNVERSQAYRLPPEVFEQILCTLDLEDRTSVARVCTLWRDYSALCIVVLPHAKYGISAGEARRYDKQLAFLGSPLVRILNAALGPDTSNDDFSATVTLVRQHMWHTERLSIVLKAAHLTEDKFDALVGCLSMPAHRLHTLALYIVTRNDLEMFKDRCGWFGGCAPRLRRCQFLGPMFYSSIFASVQTLSVYHAPHSRVEDLYVALNEFPCVEYLALLYSGGIPRPPPTRISVSPRIKHLWLGYNTVRLLNDIECSDIPYITTGLAAVPEGVWCSLIPRPAVELEIFLSSSQWVFFRTSDALKRYRAFALSCLQSLSFRDVPTSVFATPTTLRVYILRALGPIPDMPNLCCLTVYLSHAVPTASLSHILVGSYFPSLHTVNMTFMFNPEVGRRTCTGEELASFTATALSQPVHLTVRGANVVNPGLVALRACVSTLSIEPDVYISATEPAWVQSMDFRRAWREEISLCDLAS
ncbi:hypothetical protein EXIGLDRAFT_781155 [Exidia glandulosa HHB12029]|uniref:F-box domain-containing protein n=1 Tax=Exidia glandulosa HHB12029 TaxID=1314781 RepID=A0A165BC63_EXIGL|nr:hypothetical protein EXIGLDRAFT_781155 [Exidia glandulosa HHB12029]